MANNEKPILLCLVNNDPTSTILMTTAGQQLYSVSTPITFPSLAASLDQPGSSAPPRPTLFDKHRKSSSVYVASSPIAPLHRCRSNSSPPRGVAVGGPLSAPIADCHVRRGPVTIVKRLDLVEGSTGHVETTVGLIKSHKDDSQSGSGANDDPGHRRGSDDVTLELCEHAFMVKMPSPPRVPRSKSRERVRAGQTLSEGEHSENEYSSDGEWLLVEDGLAKASDDSQHAALNSWDFIGPDKRHYKWFMIVQAGPVLALVEPSAYINVARYRRPKLGIVSRSRRGFLEIFPCANTSDVDLIVTSFVGFMKQCVLPTDNMIGPVGGATSSTPRLPRAKSSGSMPGQGRGPYMKNEKESTLSKARSDTVLPTPTPPSLSSIPHRFLSASALARKRSKSPPLAAFTFPPFAVKPKIRRMATTTLHG
ncbi:hypothetical protein DFP72DRAFT_191252 [Ephemerocybe angulata]|uniref:DUF6593 domain-containing protein n=1 Tax=Ephemerocybe angulata TaxID=980116 RepID=A0A8H6I6D0_9AGAR|nr:hypothetical protein DFP72DRAFT_191252 [Tulosesus angulatus]